MKAPILLALLGLATAQAAEPTGTLTLACEGTLKQVHQPDAGPDPMSTNIVINFTDRTVTGFGRTDFPVNISANDVTVSFLGSSLAGWRLFGSIDRVSGELQAYSLFLNPFPKPNTYEIAPAVYYSLKCK
jgi:hypothetical protein